MDTLRPDTLRPFASYHVACRQPLPRFPHISRLPVVSFHDCISQSDRYPFRPAGTKNPLAPSSIRKYGSPGARGQTKERSRPHGWLLSPLLLSTGWYIDCRRHDTLTMVHTATTVLGNVCPQDDCAHSRPSRHPDSRRKDTP